MHPSRSFFGASISRFSFAFFNFVCLKIYVCLLLLVPCGLPPRRLQMRVGTLGYSGLVSTGTTAFRALGLVDRRSSNSSNRALACATLRPQQSPIVLVDGATDEALLQTGPGGGGGLFTSSNPEDRRIVPANAAGRATFKVVYVVLESQYQASMSAAATCINEKQDGVAVEVVGYLLEELRDEATSKPSNRTSPTRISSSVPSFSCRSSRRRSWRRLSLGGEMDAVGLPVHARGHAPEQGRLLHHGESWPVQVYRGDFMKSKKKQDGSSFEEGMLKLLRTLPKVLKYLPGDKRGRQGVHDVVPVLARRVAGEPRAFLLMLGDTFVEGVQGQGLVKEDDIIEPILRLTKASGIRSRMKSSKT